MDKQLTNPCYQEIKIQLPCQHFRTVRCNEKNNHFDCEEIINVPLPQCGHNVEIVCKNKNTINTLKCYESISYKLDCDHKITIHCFQKDSINRTHTCHNDITVNRTTCDHFINCKCYEKEDKLSNPCLETITIQLPCLHNKDIKCSHKVRHQECTVLIDKQLPCSHNVKVECRSVNKEVKCSIDIDHKREECGHNVRSQCWEMQEKLSYPCMKVITYTRPCTLR
eukprot:NODE_6254_length_907_cov_24.696429_g5662_i0.p1 GENE.NODE_6254_length_907_cov_24.696429_g5662_i0~~NODE_6254_length_907_cov_24.696429_g5662_i0.p1  ORF type:complete len:224 (+),score=15.73 NODE_6254_length_907_cov_24.696429_g5662_i0:232-903(+)